MVTHRINPTISSSLSLHDAEAESQAHGAQAGGPPHWVETTGVRTLRQRHPYYVVAKRWHATERVHRMQLPTVPDVAGNQIMATGRIGWLGQCRHEPIANLMDRAADDQADLDVPERAPHDQLESSDVLAHPPHLQCTTEHLLGKWLRHPPTRPDGLTAGLRRAHLRDKTGVGRSCIGPW